MSAWILKVSHSALINLIYCRHVGEKVRMDLQRKQNLPANKLANLMAKFDEVKNGGNMMPTATLAMGTMEGKRVTYRDFLVNDENICQSRHKCCAVISNSKVCILYLRGNSQRDKSVSTSL